MRREDSIESRKNLRRNSIPFLLMISLLLFFITPLHATTVSLQTGSHQLLGGEFGIAVTVDSVTDLYGLATDLTYDPEYLEVVDEDGNPANGIQPEVTQGVFLNNNGADPTLLLSALEDETPGTLVLGLSRSGHVAGVNTSTQKTILSATFKAIKKGTTVVTFNKQGLRNSSNGAISVSAWNGATIDITDLLPVISVSCPSTDFGSVAVGSSSNQSCTVSNTGTANLTFTSISITGTHASMFSQTNDCTTVTPGHSCAISMTFAPTSGGAKTATLGILSNDPNTPTVNVPLTGTGLVPDIAVAPPSPLAFGPVNVGSFLTKILTVSNNGGAPLVISSIPISGTDGTMFSQTNNCSAPVPPSGGSCTVSVTFTPTTAGGKTGTLTINSNDPDTPSLAVSLTGTGLVPDIAVASSLPFGSVNVGSFLTKLLTVTNNGNAPLIVSSITLSGPDATMFSQTNNCTSVAPAASCTVNVTFTPTLGGPRTGTLTINSNDPHTPANVALTGTGLVPHIGASPSPLDFASVPVGTHPTKVLTVSNSGDAPLMISSMSISGTYAGMFTQTNTCSTPVPPSGGSCTVSVTFTPPSAGAKTGTLTINSNDLTTPALNVILNGTGTVPNIAVDPPTSLVFGLVPVGSPSTKPVTVSNTGGAPLVVGPITISGADASMFTQTNTCSTPVAPGGPPCTISVTFRPTSAGGKAATVAIFSNDPGPAKSPVSVLLTGSGAPPHIAVSSVLWSEDFSSGIPANWPLEGAWSSGSASAPCSGRSIGAPFASPWAIVDSSCSTTFYEELYTPVFDTSPCTDLTLSFSNQYSHAPGSSAGVAVSEDGRSTWPADVLTLSANDGPNTKEIGISSAAGSEEAQIRFAYYGDGNFWAIDNVQVVCHQPDEVRFVSPLKRTASKTVVISNTGESDLHVGAISITGANAGDFTMPVPTDGCSGHAISPSQKCTVEIVFAPGDDGARNASLTIPSNDPDTPTFTLPLRGTGLFFSVSPSNGTIGTVLEITGSGFGATKGKVTIANETGTMAPKVLDWVDGLIHASLSKNLSTGTTYDVTVVPKVPKKTPPIVQPDAFEFRGPQIVWLSDDRGTVNDTIVIRGWHFGNKKGKVLIGTKSCKVVSWTMNLTTNYGEIVFMVPKGLAKGPYDLSVVNKVGTGKAESKFTIE